MLKVWGILFIIFGSLWTLAGFLGYASDIQLGIAVGGINMIGVGILMLGVHSFFQSSDRKWDEK